MAAITNADLPTFTSVEEVAVWALETLSFLNPTQQLRTGDTTSQLYASRGTGQAIGGESIFYGSIIIPLKADAGTTLAKIWKKVDPIREVTVPAAFKTNA